MLAGRLSENFAHLQVSRWALSICHFCSSLSVFLDLLPRKQTQERPLLVQDEDKLKKQEIPTETAFPRQASEETLPKVSIPIPEEQKSLKKCQLYSSIFPSPRIPFMMSFLVVIALTIWWLLFLWVGTGSHWNLKTKAPESLGRSLCCIFLVLVFDLRSLLSRGGTSCNASVNPSVFIVELWSGAWQEW